MLFEASSKLSQVLMPGFDELLAAVEADPVEIERVERAMVPLPAVFEAG